MRAILALAAALLLAGCWLGESLYTASESRPALPPGRYDIANVQGAIDGGPVDVSIRPSGLTRVADNRDQEITQLGFAPLPDAGGDHVIWVVDRLRDDGPRTMYGRLRRVGEGDYLLVFPECRRDQAAARTGRATVAGPETGSQSCTFPDRAGLEAALRRIEIDPAHLVMGMIRLRRIPNG